MSAIKHFNTSFFVSLEKHITYYYVNTLFCSIVVHSRYLIKEAKRIPDIFADFGITAFSFKGPFKKYVTGPGGRGVKQNSDKAGVKPNGDVTAF